MEEEHKLVLYKEYKTFLVISVVFIAAAFVFNRPGEIIAGLGRIFVSPGILRTEYMVIGGIGAAIINSTLVGVYSVLLLYCSRTKPTGGMIMALWMAVGWTYWGANVLTIIPLTCGVWLYSRVKKRTFSDFMVIAILGETIAPIVGVFMFSNPIMLQLGAEWPMAITILFGVAMGLICGFLMPIIAGAASNMHQGYTLYNMGVTGGFIATFLAGILRIFGINVPTETMWFTESRLQIAIFLYVVWAALLLAGLILGGSKKINHFENMKKIMAHPGKAPNDFYQLGGETAYINMALLGILTTTITLVLGAGFNGGTFACIFSVVAFGSFGKHLKNVVPILAGSILCAYLNMYEMSAPQNILPILWASCLAPICGTYGWFWGIVTGFLHVVILNHVGTVTNGFNLYNNGFTSGFVAFFLPPIIAAISKEKAKPEKA